MDLKEEIDRSIVTAGDFSTQYPTFDNGSSRQKINKETLDLNYPLDQKNWTDIYKTFHPTVVGRTFCASAHGKFSRIEHMLNHKTGLHKFKMIEIISSIFSKHSGIKLC